MGHQLTEHTAILSKPADTELHCFGLSLVQPPAQGDAGQWWCEGEVVPGLHSMLTATHLGAQVVVEIVHGLCLYHRQANLPPVTAIS